MSVYLLIFNAIMVLAGTLASHRGMQDHVAFFAWCTYFVAMFAVTFDTHNHFATNAKKVC
jgi:hypothetical protein